MVVGAYTIINTIGLLVGLPHTGYTANQEIQLNNSLTNYLLKENITNSDPSFPLYLIIDGTITQSLVVDTNQIALHYNYSTNDIYDIEFGYKSKVNNYYIFAYADNNQASDPSYYSSSYMSCDFPITTLNQIYFARLTSDLSSIDGDSIIGSITSGLGLMGDITTNFKNGFSALIWNSTDSKLTTFGNFALIFLGVSITFAIIKLCLNLIRSKTGA